MASTQIDFTVLAEKVRGIIDSCTDKNERVDGLFRSAVGFELLLDSLKKVAELASKRVKNTKKSHEFAIWFANEFESRTGRGAPDKVVNLCKEVCVNILTEYKRLFFVS